MVPSSSQASPGLPEAPSVRVIAAPPTTGIFLSCALWVKASHSPSGDQVKLKMPLVPRSGVASYRSRCLIQIWVPPSAGPT